MDLSINIQKKTNKTDIRKITKPEDVYNLKEIQEIKDGIQEYFIFLGLDNGNNIRNLSILGVGNSCNVIIDSKQILRTAIISASEKVILVHNHPSNSLKPTKEDIHISNITNRILEAFNIKMLDHIIVTEYSFVSMEELKAIQREYMDEKIETMQKGLLLEENMKLKNYIKNMNKETVEDEIEDDDEEEEM